MDINSSRLPDLRSLFEQAVLAVQGKACVSDYLQQYPVTGDIYLLAIGKAACSMAQGARNILENQIKDNLVITRHGYREPNLSGLNIIEAGHPFPDANSIEAGKQLIDFVQATPATGKLLCLISGGTSSLVEVLPDTISLDDLIQLNKWLLRSGLAIVDMNAIRKQVSCIKGGRLARYLQGREAIVLLMSDVQGDDPAIIGSGLLFPSQSHVPGEVLEKLPATIQHILLQSPPFPDTDDPIFNTIKWQVIANLSQAMRAAEYAANAKGYHVVVHQSCLQGDAIQCGKHLARILQAQPGILHIWGGEVTVNLPRNPGKGGRCQSLALSTAIEMRSKINWCLLAAGTDGSDGMMDAAGVCINSDSLAKAERKLAGDAKSYLDSADAGTFFTASGDLVITGSTGTNVTDLVFGYLDK